ncbi:MAG TPA: SDR family oxidoreductase [Cyclobacteriaceae bacterium]|nr:SDR family oxidoreductase [Cyclobacteriaceae bacterium]
MENKKNITVFGATGKIGSDLIRLLSEAQIETIAVTRNIEKAVKLPFVEWMQADLSDKQSLYETLKNSNSVFLLSGHSADFVEGQKNVVEVAKELGVKHIVKLSSGAADKNSQFHIPKTHGEVEEFLKLSGLHYTMLRPYGIMQNWLGDIADSIRKEKKFYEATGNGKRAHVDRRDIAEVAFKCLVEPEKHYDKVYLLTSDKAVNYQEVAEAISKTINEKVEYVAISINEARQEMQRNGMPNALIETFISYDEAQRNGQTEIISNSVRTVLEKPARTLENFVTDYADYFK